MTPSFNPTSWRQRRASLVRHMELLVVDGAFHGFDVAVPKAAVSQSFTDAFVASINRAVSSR